MERFETIEKVPTWALCYIINGDPTGLSDEDIKMVDEVEECKVIYHSENPQTL